MFAKDGITQKKKMQFHKLLLTFIFWKKVREACHYNVVKFLTINIS